MFKIFDVTDEGLISYDEFKAGIIVRWLKIYLVCANSNKYVHRWPYLVNHSLITTEYTTYCCLLFPGLMDLNVPLSMVEIHLLCMLLDSDRTDEIEFGALGEAMKRVRWGKFKLTDAYGTSDSKTIIVSLIVKLLCVYK